MTEAKVAIAKFNVRVYGIYVRENKVLLVKEKFESVECVKFPGGGVEFGEGLITALKREIKEELGADCTVGEHFYTTDFFQRSAFKENEQLISVYFWIKEFNLLDESLIFRSIEEGNPSNQLFHWKEISELSPNDMTFPVDKAVVSKLINRFQMDS